MGSIKGLDETGYKVLPPINGAREDTDTMCTSEMKNNIWDIFGNSVDKKSNFLNSERAQSVRKDCNGTLKGPEKSKTELEVPSSGPFSSILQNRNMGSDDER